MANMPYPRLVMLGAAPETRSGIASVVYADLGVRAIGEPPRPVEVDLRKAA